MHKNSLIKVRKLLFILGSIYNWLTKRKTRVLIIFFLPSFSFADSTQVAPPSQATPYYPSQTIPSAPVQNSNWPSACPTTTSNCPNINTPSTDPAYNPATCPTTCTVTESVSFTIPLPPPFNSESISLPISPNLPSSATINNPICPSGYVEVSQYNAQPEYTYSQNPITQWPKTMTEYYNYQNLGYTCADSGQNNGALNGSCASGVGNNASPQWPNYTTTDQIVSGQVVYMYQAYLTCYTAGSCDNPNVTINCSVSGDYQYTYHYNQVSCIRPAGNYPTGQYIPVSILCARVTPTWMSQ